MSVGCLFGLLHYTCYHHALTYIFRMESSGGFAGSEQDGASDTVKIFQAEMLAYSAYWWGGNVIFHSLEQCLLTLASLQVLCVCARARACVYVFVGVCVCAYVRVCVCAFVFSCVSNCFPHSSY